MAHDTGRFTVNDLNAAQTLIGDVLKSGGPGSKRWCNFTFEIDDELAGPPESVLFGFLAARGPSSPLATIMSAVTGKRPQPAQLGIQHRAGTRCAQQLREASLGLPESWRVVQDHPRRGLVVALPESATTDQVATWMLSAMRILNRAPTTDGVVYELYEAS